MARLNGRIANGKSMKSRIFEQVYPYLFAFSLGVAMNYSHIAFPCGQDILSATITLGAVFTGFLATLKSVVFSLQGPRMRKFKATSFYPLLLNYLRQAIWASLLFCAVGLVGFYYEPTKPWAWFGSVWVFLGSLTLLTFLRVSNAMMSLLKAAD
jgi:hypothetical protein